MPTAFRDGPYRFHFYSGDCDEPPHIHVRRDRMEAKFWLEPVEVEREGGFSGHALRSVRNIITERLEEIMEAWYEHCGS